MDIPRYQVAMMESSVSIHKPCADAVLSPSQLRVESLSGLVKL
jgi:hypothetical protein